eukprot:m.215652 g.215652  ORF g.215652 m.215652 type:complete len:141 (+) comp19108_c1_seq7:317-739(+)
MPREIPKVRQTASRAELMDMRYAAAKAGGHQIDVEMSLSYDEGTGQLFASLVSASNFSKEFEGKTVQLALIFIGFGGERRSTSKTVKVTDQHVVFNSKTGSLLWDVTKSMPVVQSSQPFYNLTQHSVRCLVPLSTLLLLY